MLPHHNHLKYQGCLLTLKHHLNCSKCKDPDKLWIKPHFRHTNPFIINNLFLHAHNPIKGKNDTSFYVSECLNNRFFNLLSCILSLTQHKCFHNNTTLHLHQKEHHFQFVRRVWSAGVFLHHGKCGFNFAFVEELWKIAVVFFSLWRTSLFPKFCPSGPQSDICKDMDKVNGNSGSKYFSDFCSWKGSMNIIKST